MVSRVKKVTKATKIPQKAVRKRVKRETVEKVHPSHVTRMSDASTFDEICVNCGFHDQVPGGLGDLVKPCPNAPKPAKRKKRPAAAQPN